MRAQGLVLLVLLALSSTVSDVAQEDHLGSPEKLGTVNFATSCSPASQPQFNRAVALMHSFQFARTIEAFQGILASEPSCSMAWWGIALSNWGNPFAAGIEPQAQLDRGLDAVTMARAANPKTARESSYIEAASHLFTGSTISDQRSRVLAYESAMANLSAAYPEDTEASIFYALAIAAAADPTDKTYARQLKAGKILEDLYARFPDHPGLAHYIIHTYDVPPLASRAAAAARHYSEIAPSTPHALHMPSHTFTRLGDWQSSIHANIASAASARSAGQPAEELHASDYLEYAYLQTGQDAAARLVLESTPPTFARFDPAELIGGAANPAAAYFAYAAIPARYALERQAWADAAKLVLTPSPYPQTESITWFAIGLAATHLKDRDTARRAIEALEQNREKLLKSKETYWANQVEIQRQEVVAWLAFADGKSHDALAAMRNAAELEDNTEKSAVTPGPLAPARELLGDMLLELKRPTDALKEFEATLVREPNRFRSLYGAAEAAKLSGVRQAAQTYFRKLLKVAGQSDQPARMELAEVKRELQPE
jgi:tetratricopeptide (TPR) repeat protein